MDIFGGLNSFVLMLRITKDIILDSSCDFLKNPKMLTYIFCFLSKQIREKWDTIVSVHWESLLSLCRYMCA